MSNNTTNCLVHCSACLQSIPALTVYLKIRFFFALTVEILLLLKYSRIINARVWNPDHKNSPSCVVYKIYTFTEFTSTNAREEGSLSFIDSFYVFFENWFEVFCSFCFTKHFTLKIDLLVIPGLQGKSHAFIRGKENEDSTRDIFLHLLNELTQADCLAEICRLHDCSQVRLRIQSVVHLKNCPSESTCRW